MSFATPAALLLAAIALPIIALYILKVRLRRVKVSTNLFWKQVYEEKPPRSLWQNLRHLLSLLAQLFLLLLLVLAVADPYFSWQALQARRMVIVLDTSASMKATDVSPSRFEAARLAAHRLLDGLRFRDELAIISAGHQPDVVIGMASHVPTLRRAIDSVHPVDSSAALDAAIDLAKQLIGEHPHGQVIVLSDGCVSDVGSGDASAELNPLAHGDNARPDSDSQATVASTKKVGPDVVTYTFATAAANVGITQLQVRRSLIDAIGYEILVTVRNASSQSVQGRLELELEGIPVDIIPVHLKPEETWTRSIEKASLEGGVLKAALTKFSDTEGASEQAEEAKEKSQDVPPANASEKVARRINMLSVDDVAWTIVPPRKVQKVLIVTPGNLFLRKVFEANPLVQISVRQDLPSEWPADTIVVLHRSVPQNVPAGKVLVIDPEADSDLWELGATIENPIVTEQNQQSALMAHIRLDNVLMPEARRLSFKQPIDPLAATVTGESVYAAVARPSGPCLVLSVNLDRSDLAFRTVFPILITNALGWFDGQHGEMQPSLLAGQSTLLTIASPPPFSTAVARSVSHAVVEEGDRQSDDPSVEGNVRERTLVLSSPSGKQATLLSKQIGPLDEVGIWNVVEMEAKLGASDDRQVAEAEVRERFAVNLGSLEESDLRPRSAESSSAITNHLAASWFTRPLWVYLGVVASLFCALEWYLYQRRLIA